MTNIAGHSLWPQSHSVLCPTCRTGQYRCSCGWAGCFFNNNPDARLHAGLWSGKCIFCRRIFASPAALRRHKTRWGSHSRMLGERLRLHGYVYPKRAGARPSSLTHVGGRRSKGLQDTRGVLGGS